MNKEIRLSEAEQLYLKDFVKNGSHKSKEIIRARVLLMLDRTGKVDHVRYNRTAEYGKSSFPINAFKDFYHFKICHTNSYIPFPACSLSCITSPRCHLSHSFRPSELHCHLSHRFRQSKRHCHLSHRFRQSRLHCHLSQSF